MPVTESIVRTLEGEIALCDTGGDGLPLLMLHGSGAAKEVFAQQLESPLTDLHRMIAIDLPGHGASSNAARPETAYTLTGLAGTVAAVLRELEIGRVIAFGWSLGGHIAIEMMSAYPQLLAGVMLTGTPPVGHGALGLLRGFHARWDVLLASKQMFTRRDAERFERLCYGDGASGAMVETILRADGRMRAAFMRSIMRGDGADQKRTVEESPIPLAMVNGADEPITRLGYVASLKYKNLWEGRCHTIAGAGHAPFWQTPNTFNALLHRFVEDISVRERAPEIAPEEVARTA